MVRLTPVRLYALAIAVGLLGFFGLGVLARDSTASRWDGLFNSRQAEYVFVLNLASCQLDARDIQELNSWARKNPIPVRAVLLSPPPDDTTRQRLVGQFSLGIPATWDDDQRWKNILVDLNLGGDAAILARANRPYAIVKSKAWRLLAASTPN